MNITVGMYAHHQGAGHLQRCRAIAEHLSAQVTILSSLPDADIGLPLDTAPEIENYAEFTADNTLHWVPLHVDGLRQRMALIAQWIQINKPDVFFVDVSVEVAQFVRLMGVPVITIAMPGERTDTPHQTMYAQATALIAACPSDAPVPAHLQGFADKLYAVGGISRFEAQESLTSESPYTEQPKKMQAVVLQGRGGTAWTQDYWDAVALACPSWNFTVLGGNNRVENPMPYLTHADVVISASGQNSVADIALAGTSAIFIPQERAFGEQRATARVLEYLGLATVVWDLPQENTWAGILEQACKKPAQWNRWQVVGGAQRAARIIEEKAGKTW